MGNEVLSSLLPLAGIDVSKDLELKQMLEPKDKEEMQQTLKEQIG